MKKVEQEKMTGKGEFFFPQKFEIMAKEKIE